MNANLPLAINIDDCKAIPSDYTYIGVYSSSTEDAQDVSRLRLLYDLRDHTGDDIWDPSLEDYRQTDHWSAFASRINDHWSGLGGYAIVAFQDLSGLKETYTGAELGALVTETALFQSMVHPPQAGWRV